MSSPTTKIIKRRDLHKVKNNSTLNVNNINNNKISNFSKLNVFKNSRIENNEELALSDKRKCFNSNLPELKILKCKNRLDSEKIPDYKINKNKTLNKNIIQKSHSLTKYKNNVLFPKILKENNVNNNEINTHITINNFSSSRHLRPHNTIIHCNSNNNINRINHRNNKKEILNNNENYSFKNFNSHRNNSFDNCKTRDNKLNYNSHKLVITNINKKNNSREKNSNKLNHKLIFRAIPKPNSKHINNNKSPALNIIPKMNEKINNYEEKIIPSSNNKSSQIDKENDKTIENNNNMEKIDTKIILNREIKNIDLISEKLNAIANILSKLSSISKDNDSSKYNTNIDFNNNNIIRRYNNTIEISKDILYKNYSYYNKSIISNENEFDNENIIKAYAYNTSNGNIRNYNEDTISIKKIILNNNNNFYFFAIYDGHGGNNCSLYLQKNLYNNIKEFSSKSLQKAIYETEQNFLLNESMDINKNLKDTSGSCGIISIIQKNKCIIANIGDSRIVIFKNYKIELVTTDHKPNNEKEKNRITKAGGQIYKNNNNFPIYQNGKKIETPWRVLPGRLSVSRTFGDVEAKYEKFGGKEGVIIACPDIYEIELNKSFNFMVIACDGVFDVLSNEDLMKCLEIVIKEKKGNNIREICGFFAEMIIKSALAKGSFDNVSCIVVVFNIDGIMGS